MDILRLVLDGCRRGLMAVLAILRTIPALWLVVMGLVAIPIAILSALVALVFSFLLLLVALLWALFYLAVWRPVLGSARRPPRVIEVEYSVKDDDGP